MTQQYFYKATLRDKTSGYDHSFHYQMGENVHPDPDLSDVVCGRGFHLAKSLADCQSYVPDAKEYYLARPRRILGSDSTKIRTDCCTLLIRIPKSIIDDYFAKRKPLDDDYDAKLKPLRDDYFGKLKSLGDDYVAKLKPLRDDYVAKLKSLGDDYVAKLKPLDDKLIRKVIRLCKQSIKE